MEIIKKLCDKFDKNTLILKLAEECTELSEVLIKTVTKGDTFRPPVEKIIEESGDVIFRMKVLATKLGITDEINERVKTKGIQINEWFDKLKS